MRLTVSLRGLESDGGQSEICKKTLYASDKRFNAYRRRLEINGATLVLDLPEEPALLHARIDLPQYGNIWVMAEVSHTTRYPVPIDFIKLAQGTYLKYYERTDAESDSEASPATRAHLAQALDYINLADLRTRRGESGEAVNYDELLALSYAIRAAEDRRFEVSREKAASAPREGFLLGCNAH